MEMISWNDSLSVKIKSFDDQHKKLIELINQFYANISLATKKEMMLDVIKSLKDYTVLHFTTEERYMKLHGFPGYEAHLNEHKSFIEKVNSFEERYSAGKLVLSVEITNFIKEWVTNHIMGTDKKYSSFLVLKGVK